MERGAWAMNSTTDHITSSLADYDAMNLPLDISPITPLVNRQAIAG
jgi:hypothetical protein